MEAYATHNVNHSFHDKLIESKMNNIIQVERTRITE